jgi:hypothetical protein
MTLRSTLANGALFAATAAVVLTTAIAVPGVSMAQPYDQSYQDQVAQAQAACQQQQNSRAVGGAILGGLAGAALGNGLSRGGGRTGGTVIGGVAGAAVGAGVGASTTDCSGDYPPPPPPGYAGGPPPPPPGYYPPNNCGWAQEQIVFPDGSRSNNQIQACQDQSGRWYLTPPPQ